MRRTLFALNGLRAVAATMVAIAHLMMRLLDYKIIDQQWSSLTAFGSAGVYTFFVISGFVIIRSSRDLFGTPNAARVFLVRRIIRIVPLYYIFTSIFILKLALENQYPGLHEIIFSFTFIPYMNSSALMQPIYTLGWTLNYEMYFYTIFALCLRFEIHRGAFLIFLIITATVVSAKIFGKTDVFGDPKDMLAFFGSPVVLFFICGIFIGFVDRLRDRYPSSYCFFAACLILITGVLVNDLYFMAIACILAVCFAASENAKLSHSRSEKLLNVLGEASYSIYLSHSFVIGPSFYLCRRLGLMSGSTVLLACVFCIGLSLAIGVIVFFLVERPMLNYLNINFVKKNSLRLRSL